MAVDRDALLSLFQRLLACTTSSEVRSILTDIGDSDASTIEVPFGKHGLVWKPFGNNASNVSSVGLGSKSGRSLTERVTNAIDAVLEDRAPTDIALPTSPRLAANRWFGRPISGADSGLFSWKEAPERIDRHVHVLMQSSEKESSPTVDVVDDGIGIEARHFHNTILSLQGRNKIRKLYLVGAFGQGGAATLGFCDYAIIFSRAKSKAACIAFTVIRVLRLDASYKDDCYAYLSCRNSVGGEPEVLEVDVGKEPIELYPQASGSNVPRLEKGTVVRHVAYRLTNLNKTLHSSPGNLYHYLHFSMFDPLIPFRVVDLRGASPNDQRVGGARNRLMNRLRQAKESSIDDDEKNIQIRHYRPMEYVVPSGSTDACIGIEYWVVLAFRKKGNDYELRGHSNELFVQQGHPIIGTLNGQNQGEATAQLLRQLDLSLLARHIVIHIDATNADSSVRRDLFASSREAFKEGPVLDSVLGMVKKILEEDEALPKIERELTDRITRKEAESTKTEVKREVSRLLREAGLSVREKGQVDVPGPGEKHQVERQPGPGPQIVDPLPTLPFPEVTRFEIVYPKDMFQVHLNDIQGVVIETDADALYDKHIQIRSDPPLLQIATRAPLRGGRIRWRLRPVQGATAGRDGEVIATLTKPDGTQILDRVLFELLAAREKEAKKAEGHVPPFEIKPITPEQSETWNALWPADNDDPDVQKTHAYRAFPAGGTVIVYYSTFFGPYREAVERLKSLHPGRLLTFETNYEIWIGYHAILQSQQPIHESNVLGEEVVEQIQEIERQTVARVQVRQAMRTAELIEQKALTAEART
jgi:hypothetical protein